MRCLRAIAPLSVVALGGALMLMQAAQAQEAPEPAVAQADPPAADAGEASPREEITIGLSSDVIEIATDFTGMDLTIFGSVNNPRADSIATGGYDVIVVLEGPPRPLIIREKKRVLGMWVNADSMSFDDVQRSYVLASTGALQDIATDELYRQLALGVDQRFFAPANPREASWRVEAFSAALKELKERDGLYHEGTGDVRFLSQSLFKASLAIPSNIPLGTHRARAFLFKNGMFLDEDSTGLYVTKDSFEQWLFRQSQQNGFLYGLVAVLIAMLTGWLGRLMFRRD
ncbi:MAG: TIGR02186 family protein [Rhizobiaceae bacterium]|jgi:uncharacterized protein (TIGR02186 family)|nr:TIGR02186 family protein [Rhizobiaceae bacterium]